VLHYDGTFIAFVKLCSAIVLYRCNDGGAVFQLVIPSELGLYVADEPSKNGVGENCFSAFPRGSGLLLVLLDNLV